MVNVQQSLSGRLGQGCGPLNAGSPELNIARLEVLLATRVSGWQPVTF